MIAPTATRVHDHTSAHLNEEIRRRTEASIARFARPDQNAAIGERLAQLDREWDVERALQANFAAVSLLGLLLGAKVDKRWLALAGVAPAFMVQHALQGWCPPLALLRRLGFRTAREIGNERFALKSLRGDFEQAATSHAPNDLARAAKT